MTIIISDQLEARLKERAKQEGADTNTVAEALLAAALDWEARERAEAIAGIRRGLDAAEAGRVRPAEDVFAEMRARLAQTER
jgi:predicted transcriptional regulator